MISARYASCWEDVRAATRRCSSTHSMANIRIRVRRVWNEVRARELSAAYNRPSSWVVDSTRATFRRQVLGPQPGTMCGELPSCGSALARSASAVVESGYTSTMRTRLLAGSVTLNVVTALGVHHATGASAW